MITEARQLYALAPAEFIAERNRTAKSLKADGRADDAAFVSGLRRPKLAEYGLNIVAHNDHALVERLVTAAGAATSAQAAALRGAKGSLREATSALRDATREVIDAAVHGLNESGASGEGQRDEISELVRTLLAGPGSAQLLAGVVGFEGVEAADDLFAGAPDLSDVDDSELATVHRLPARKTAEPKKQVKAAAKAPAPKPAGQRAKASADVGARARHLARQEERARLLRRTRETGGAVDDAERQLAVASKTLAKAQREVDRAQAALDRATATAAIAQEAVDAFDRAQKD